MINFFINSILHLLIPNELLKICNNHILFQFISYSLLSLIWLEKLFMWIHITILFCLRRRTINSLPPQTYLLNVIPSSFPNCQTISDEEQPLNNYLSHHKQPPKLQISHWQTPNQTPYRTTFWFFCFYFMLSFNNGSNDVLLSFISQIHRVPSYGIFKIHELHINEFPPQLEYRRCFSDPWHFS